MQFYPLLRNWGGGGWWGIPGGGGTSLTWWHHCMTSSHQGRSKELPFFSRCATAAVYPEESWQEFPPSLGIPLPCCTKKRGGQLFKELPYPFPSISHSCNAPGRELFKEILPPVGMLKLQCNWRRAEKLFKELSPSPGTLQQVGTVPAESSGHLSHLSARLKRSSRRSVGHVLLPISWRAI